MLISTHMQDLKDTTQDVHYENFRAQCISQISQHALRERGKLKRESISSHHESGNITETDRLLLQKDEEVSFRCISRLQFTFYIKTIFVFRFTDPSHAGHADADAGAAQGNESDGTEEERQHHYRCVG